MNSSVVEVGYTRCKYQFHTYYNTAMMLSINRAIRFVIALLDYTLYSSLPFPTHLGPLDLYLDSHRTIANTHGSPFHSRNTISMTCKLYAPLVRTLVPSNAYSSKSYIWYKLSKACKFIRFYACLT